MRKRIVLILAMLLLLTGCGAAAEPEAAQSTTVPVTVPTTAPTETTEPAEPAVSVRYLLETEARYEKGNLVYSWSYFYDDLGKELSSTEYSAYGDSTTLFEVHYDDQGREISRTKTLEDGSTEEYIQYVYFDAEGYREERSYGYIYSISEMNLLVRREYFNDQGRVIRSETYVDDEWTAATEYDAQGQTLRSESNTHITVYERDGQGNLTRQVQTSKQDGSQQITLYTNTYDDENRLLLSIKSVDGNDTERTDYTYEGSRITKTVTYLKDTIFNNAGDTQTTITDYDENGNMIRKETVGGGIEEYTYIALEFPG